MEHTSRLPGFYRRPLRERRAVLVERFGLSPSELAAALSALVFESRRADDATPLRRETSPIVSISAMRLQEITNRA